MNHKFFPMKNLGLNLRMLALIFVLAFSSAKGQIEKDKKSNILETRLLVQALMQETLSKDLGIDTEKKSKCYILDKESKLNVPRRIYINDLVVEVINEKQLLTIEGQRVLQVDTLNVDQGLALVKVYTAHKDPMKTKDTDYVFQYRAEDAMADMSVNEE